MVSRLITVRFVLSRSGQTLSMVCVRVLSVRCGNCVTAELRRWCLCDAPMRSSSVEFFHSTRVRGKLTKGKLSASSKKLKLSSRRLCALRFHSALLTFRCCEAETPRIEKFLWLCALCDIVIVSRASASVVQFFISFALVVCRNGFHNHFRFLAQSAR